MALGAARSRVIGAVMRGALLQTVVGLAIGIPVAIFCVRYVKSQLFEITSVNIPVMAIAIGVLALAAAIAGIIPARRAASIDPGPGLALSNEANARAAVPHRTQSIPRHKPALQVFQRLPLGFRIHEQNHDKLHHRHDCEKRKRCGRVEVIHHHRKLKCNDRV